VVAPCLCHQHAARQTRAHADAAARESREGFQTSIETLSDPLVSLGQLGDHADCIVELVSEYANGAACVANILEGQDGRDSCARPGLEEYGVADVRGYVIGHPAPIAGLWEECSPWPT
jgi:hypothetical protein